MPSISKQWLGRDQRGITGLETAIILIAFVVVASVFAYTVLSAGIFSSEKGKEAIHAGLEQARGSMELVGSVKASSIAATLLDNVDPPSSWTMQTNVTAATDASDRKEGTASIDLTVAAAFTTGLVASKDLTSVVDLTSPQHYSVQLWIKSDTALAAGVLELVLDDSAACDSPLESIALPALATGTWEHPVVALSGPTALNAVDCVGLTAPTDPGASDVVLTVDLIEAPSEVTSLSFAVANALDGEALNLTTTADGTGDGLLSDEGTKNHVVSLIYSDAEQRTTDVAWTRIQLGKGDDDALLEPGEKMQITVSTIAANPMPVAGRQFTLTMVREQGAELTVERTLPSVLTAQMDLN